MCSLEGSTHVTTFDFNTYGFFGAGSFLLLSTNGWSVQIDIADKSPDSPRLEAVYLKMNSGLLEIRSDGRVYLDDTALALPHTSDALKVYAQTTTYIQVFTIVGLKMQVQLAPLMQLYLTVPTSMQGQTQGLCGSYNAEKADDLRTPQGIVESVAPQFVAAWSSKPLEAVIAADAGSVCRYEDLSKNCELIGPPAFLKCKDVVDPLPYYQNCKHDSCHCGQDCFCASVSAYAHACALRGVIIANWNPAICASKCPAGQVFVDSASPCEATCRGVAEPSLCDGEEPASGCQCAAGTLLDSASQCVAPELCPCYVGNRVVINGQSYSVDGRACVCKAGKITCESSDQGVEGCVSPKVYANCSQLADGDLGVACQASCRSAGMPCMKSSCQSGCTCPAGLVLDDAGACVVQDACPCVHNGVTYRKGEVATVDCNKCTCNGGVWSCTNATCPGMCKMYGDGHFITYDGRRFIFDGKCDYAITQDYCGGASGAGTFQIITDNEDCGTTGVSCSKSVRLFVKAYNVEVRMKDGAVQVLPVSGAALPDVGALSVHSVGLYRIVQTDIGVMVMWDRHTSIFVKLDASYKGKVCGLCGNFNGDVSDDFRTADGTTVASAVAFGNSWKMKESCAAVEAEARPCERNPYRLVWAQRKCNIINSDVFQDCHDQVYHVPYFDACVRDSCACDTGGDCECFCTAVAAYAQACNEAGVCVKWRTPERCPVFCDYYNKDDSDCTWHYSACGTLPLTCRKQQQPGGFVLPRMEGCYPRCPSAAPYLDENSMRCVALSACSCYLGDEVVPAGGQIVISDSCQVCNCKDGQLTCTEAAGCCVGGKVYAAGSVISKETDAVGLCTFTKTCMASGAVKDTSECKAITSAAPTTTAGTKAPQLPLLPTKQVVVVTTEGPVTTVTVLRSTVQLLTEAPVEQSDPHPDQSDPHLGQSQPRSDQSDPHQDQ
ncbi:mucin-2-like [Lampetra fluviatilis]